MNPWIVRSLLAFLALEVGICVAFLAESWEPLRIQERALFSAALSAKRAGDEFVLDEAEPSSRTLQVRPLERGPVQPYIHVGLDKDSEPVLETLPPAPNYWHVLLKHMREAGCEVAAIEHPLSWEGDGYYHLALLRTLDRSLARFDLAVLTVDLQRLPQDQPIPDYLASSAIPIENVRGELGSLVRVNHVRQPPSASAAPNIRFSFRIQESVEEVTPQFVRWEDGLIPSFPLAVAMAQYKVAPGEVTIDLGHHIRLGEGPIVPIDEAGQLDWERMELLESAEPIAISAHEAALESELPRIKALAADLAPRCALFTNALPDNPAPWSSHQDLQCLISSFDILPHPSGTETHHRLALALEVAILVSLAVAAGLLVGLRGSKRSLAFLGLALGGLALLATLFLTSRYWTPVAPVLATALVGWLLSLRMTRYLEPGPTPVPEG